MQNVPLDNENVSIGPPEGWDVEKHGECLTLSVHAQEHPLYGRILYTLWQFSEEERALIAAGHPLQIGIHLPRHPVMTMGVLGSDGKVTELHV